MDQPQNYARQTSSYGRTWVSLWGETTFADCEIVCNGTTWRCHKLILMTRCPFFRKAFSGNWVENQSGVVKIGNFESDIVEIMLKFLYDSSKPSSRNRTSCVMVGANVQICVETNIDGVQSPQSSHNLFTTHTICTKVFEAACFFDIEGLCEV